MEIIGDCAFAQFSFLGVAYWYVIQGYAVDSIFVLYIIFLQVFNVLECHLIMEKQSFQ